MIFSKHLIAVRIKLACLFWVPVDKYLNMQPIQRTAMKISACTLLRNHSSWYLKHSTVIFASKVFIWLLVLVIFIFIVHMYTLCKTLYVSYAEISLSKSIYLIISGKGFRCNRDLQILCLMRLLYFDRFLNISYTMKFDQKRNK